MAPGAQMDLANFDTEVELANASQWLSAQGVTVINASWGYFTSGPGRHRRLLRLFVCWRPGCR